MGAEVYFWWMVIITGNSATTLPMPYQTDEMCEWAADQAYLGQPVRCIPQPAADVAEFSATWAMPRADVCEVPTP